MCQYQVRQSSRNFYVNKINGGSRLCALSRSRRVVEFDESVCDSLSGDPNLRLGGAEMWKPEHRRAAERRGLRYPSDLTDAEWALVEPMIPPAKRGGASARGECVARLLNAIFYVLSTGCQWQALPRTCRRRARRIRYFMLWDGTERWSAPTTRSTSTTRERERP